MPPKSAKPKITTTDDLGENPFARESKRPPAKKQNIIKSGNAGSSKPDPVPGEPVAPPPLFRAFPSGCVGDGC